MFLVAQDGLGPAVLDNRLSIPLTPSSGLRLLEGLDYMAPWNCAIAIAQFGIDLTSELRHVFEAAN